MTRGLRPSWGGFGFHLSPDPQHAVFLVFSAPTETACACGSLWSHGAVAFMFLFSQFLKLNFQTWYKRLKKETCLCCSEGLCQLTQRGRPAGSQAPGRTAGPSLVWGRGARPEVPALSCHLSPKRSQISVTDSQLGRSQPVVGEVGLSLLVAASPGLSETGRASHRPGGNRLGGGRSALLEGGLELRQHRACVGQQRPCC